MVFFGELNRWRQETKVRSVARGSVCGAFACFVGPSLCLLDTRKANAGIDRLRTNKIALPRWVSTSVIKQSCLILVSYRSTSVRA